jgi:hypothetical protein
MLRFLRCAFACLLFPPALLVGGPPLQNTESSEGQWVFSLVPRAFQKNPLVDQTVVTELTEDGKKLPPPSPDHPVYYVIDAAGYHAEGQGPEDDNPPTPAELTASLRRALAVNGYRPATPAQPPALLIVYFWGVHTNLDAGTDAGPGFPDIGHKNLLSRAALVGGSKFAEELRQVLQRQDREDEVRVSLPPEFGMMLANFGPLRLFTERDAKTRQLYEETRADCYYAVASAYDYAEAAQGRRKLLWRSKLTADAQSVAMRDTLPGLILNAGKYLGVDMPEAATMTKPVQRNSQVTLGPLEVEEYLDPAAAPPAKPKN